MITTIIIVRIRNRKDRMGAPRFVADGMVYFQFNVRAILDLSAPAEASEWSTGWIVAFRSAKGIPSRSEGRHKDFCGRT
jgi:hypothetical protein